MPKASDESGPLPALCGLCDDGEPMLWATVETAQGQRTVAVCSPCYLDLQSSDYSDSDE